MAFVAVIPAIGTGLMAALPAIGGVLSTGIGALGTGLGALGGMASSLPIIGGPLGSLLGAGGSLLGAGGAAGGGLAGMFGGGGLGSLTSGLGGMYGGLDAALGGLLPNLGIGGTIGPGAGFLGSGGLNLIGPQGLFGAGGATGAQGPNLGQMMAQAAPDPFNMGQTLGQMTAANPFAGAMPNVGPAPLTQPTGSGLWGAIDNILGGILPGGQPIGEGWLGKGYGGLDSMLGGYLPGGVSPGGTQGNSWGNSFKNFFGFGQDANKEDIWGNFPGQPGYLPDALKYPDGKGPSLFDKGKGAFDKVMGSPLGDMMRGIGEFTETMDPTDEQKAKGETSSEIDALKKEIAALRGSLGTQGAQGAPGVAGIQYGLGSGASPGIASLLSPVGAAAFAPQGFTPSPSSFSPGLQKIMQQFSRGANPLQTRVA